MMYIEFVRKYTSSSGYGGIGFPQFIQFLRTFYFISNFNELQQVIFYNRLLCSTLYGLEDKVMEYDYKEKINEMVGKIEDVKFLAFIYGRISESIKIRE